MIIDKESYIIDSNWYIKISLKFNLKTLNLKTLKHIYIEQNIQ